MRNTIKRIVSLFVCIVIFCSWLPIAYAEDFYNRTTFLDQLLLGIVHGTSSIPLIGDAVQGIAGGLLGGVCSGSDDGLHHATKFVDGTLRQEGGVNYALGICSYCGDTFKICGADLSAAYDDYVSSLPATGYNSEGKLIWNTFASFTGAAQYARVANDYTATPRLVYQEATELPFWAYVENSTYASYGVYYSSNSSGKALSCETRDPKHSSFRFGFGVKFNASAPISGSYKQLPTLFYSARLVSSGGDITENSENFSADSSLKHYVSGQEFPVSFSKLFRDEYYSFASAGVYFPIYEIIPDTAVSGDTYNTTTRPTSITGGNYGVVGDNNQITVVEDNSPIVDETNNTYYNVTTGEKKVIQDWSYDYGDRSYDLTLDSGDKVTVTYGDEQITIIENDTTYNVYYIVDGSGTETPPAVCEHDWQKGEATIPTCVRPGSAVYTCTKCQETKTESIPALGHNWQVKQTVTTEYDDTGQLVQEGYTIFECSTCHEQYKSSDGTIPPGGSGTDPGGDEEDEGFLSWLLGKVGELLGTIGDGILNLLRTALDKIFGGLIDLVNSLFENLAKLVDLFGSVGEAFQVLWTWLPPEIIAILVAGVSIFVFVALLKFFMK